MRSNPHGQPSSASFLVALAARGLFRPLTQALPANQAGLSIMDAVLRGALIASGPRRGSAERSSTQSALALPIRDPDRFDPSRFDAPRREDQAHRFAWLPFGGGAHKCIGMHFGTLEVKAILHEMLRTYTWDVAPGYQVRWDNTSLPIPVDGLPVRSDCTADERRVRAVLEPTEFLDFEHRAVQR